MDILDRVNTISHIKLGETIDPISGEVWDTRYWTTTAHRLCNGVSHTSTCNFINQVIDETIAHLEFNNLLGKQLIGRVQELINGIRTYLLTCSTKSYRVEVEQALEPSINRLIAAEKKYHKTISLKDNAIIHEENVQPECTSPALTVVEPVREHTKPPLVEYFSNEPDVVNLGKLMVPPTNKIIKQLSPVTKRVVVPCNNCGYRIKKFCSVFIEHGIIQCPKCQLGYIINKDKISPRRPEDYPRIVASNQIKDLKKNYIHPIDQGYYGEHNC